MNKENVYFYVMRIGEHKKHKSSEEIIDEAIKIGTSNNVERRMKELKRQYKTDEIELLAQFGPYTRYKAERTEERNRKHLRENEKWKWIPQDRFLKPRWVNEVKISVRGRRVEKFPVYF